MNFSLDPNQEILYYTYLTVLKTGGFIGHIWYISTATHWLNFANVTLKNTFPPLFGIATYLKSIAYICLTLQNTETR